MDLLARALGELKASADKPYLDAEADGHAAEQYYAGLEPSAASLGTLIAETHRDKPHYSPATEIYPWVDLQPDGKVRSIYTLDEYDPAELIEEAARIHEER